MSDLGLKRGTVRLVKHNPDWGVLFEEERKIQIEEAKKIEMIKRNIIPGMSNLYEQDILNKFNVQNYQEN